MRARLLLCVVLSLFASHPAFAQGNDLYGPAGGRAALMGNTGVALGRDGAAPLYNPAAIVRVRDAKLAFSSHFFAFNLQSFSDWHQPGSLNEPFGRGSLGGTNLTTSTFHLPPSTICLFLTLEDIAELAGSEDFKQMAAEHEAKQKLAFCFASLESEDVDLQAIHFQGETRAGPVAQVQSLERHFSRVYVGPTYSMNVSPRLALGAALQVVYTSSSFGINGTSLSSTTDGGGAATTLTTSGRGRTFGLTAVLGATYRLSNVTFGASVRAPTLRLTGSYEGTYERSITGGGQDPEAVLASGTGALYSAPPTRFALGAGVRLGRWTFELDGALNVPLQSLMRAELDVTEDRRTDGPIERTQSKQRFNTSSHLTINPSAGAEYRINQGLSLLAGVSANWSALGALHPTSSIGNLVQSRTHHINLAAGMGSYWDDGELLFGLQLDFGWGQAFTIDPYALPNEFAVVNARTYTVMFVLSGAANLKTIVSTVNRIAGGEDTEEHVPQRPK